MDSERNYALSCVAIWAGTGTSYLRYRKRGAGEAYGQGTAQQY